MITTVPNLPVLALALLHASMLAGLGLIVFVPFFQGLAVILAGVLLYVGYASFQAHTFAGMEPIAFAGVLVLALSGIFSSWWSEKLGLRFTYVSREVAWGAFLGLCVMAIMGLGLFWQVMGMFGGAIAAEIYVRKRRFVEALRNGPLAIYSMLGPRGFQLLMAILVVDLGLLYTQGIPGTP